MSAAKKTVGVVGARGYVGAELLRLIDQHHELNLAFASSRSLAGQVLSRVVPGCVSDAQFEHLSAQEIAARNADVVVLALPNDLAANYVQYLEANTIVLDLSADYRFNDDWYYGLPELTRIRASGAKRISNPGCYATAMQLALAPVVDLLDGPPACFGVSGYSGAGTTASDKNDPGVLKDNLLPYKSTGHLHEREVSQRLGLAVHFMPNVAAFFRGIAMTVNARLKVPAKIADIDQRFRDYYEQEPLVRYQNAAPYVHDLVGQPGAVVGGCELSAEGDRLVIHSSLDNLLKGAATQALQNINLACGLDETEGITIG